MTTLQYSRTIRRISDKQGQKNHTRMYRDEVHSNKYIRRHAMEDGSSAARNSSRSPTELSAPHTSNDFASMNALLSLGMKNQQQLWDEDLHKIEVALDLATQLLSNDRVLQSSLDLYKSPALSFDHNEDDRCLEDDDDGNSIISEDD